MSACSQHVTSSGPPHSYGHGHGHSRFSEGNEHQAKQQLVLSLPDPFCLGPHGIEVLWKLLILTAFLGTCAFLIYLWRTILAIKPRQYEVTLDQIKMKINNLKNENRDLEKNIASWEEKAREAKKQAETKREHKRSLAGVRKLKAQDALADQELRALTSKNQELKERKTFLEDQCNALSSKEAELNLLKKKLDMVVEFSENRKLTAEEKLEEKLYELNATKNELLAADKYLKVTEEEMEKYRQEVEEMREELQESNLTFNHKIAVQERNALANWMKARYWETRMMQQSRENAYLKYRLRMMQREMLPVGSVRRELMPGRPESQKPVWQASRVVPRMNSSTSPQSDPEMHTVARGVREFPHCPGLLRMPYHMGWNVPDFPPPHPPPQWWTWGPRPHFVPPPQG
ncbi:transport and Golgi organization protein 1 homolog isoform X1 [Mustela putorius furo]|uniref:Transport and Golgi organization protein 1 homolog isoform X1 n=2 Tax=Mustela putorius furo TaxID=9669 RepID=A0A8U0SCU4_MUSPF|nr:transport and Golgi organization protein 1 homolog isoform X1 [Mustela putorius furo]